jgi:hypothetical protein
MNATPSRIVVLCAVLAYTTWLPLRAQQAPTPQPTGCVVSGKIVSGTMAIPGVSVTVRAGDKLVAATSTGVDGTYRLTVPAGATYQMLVEMTAFAKGEREVNTSATPCAQTFDFGLVLASRVAGAAPRPAAVPAAATAAGGRAGAAGPAGQRFSAIDVQANATGAAALEVTPPDRQAEQAALAMLPPGFTMEVTEAVAINGQMTNIDRGMMNDRLGAIGRGEFDPTTGTFAGGLPGQEGLGPQGMAPGGRGGRGAGPGGRGGAPGDFAIGGRGRGQSLFQFTSNYSFSGSALNSDPYQLRPGSAVTNRPYNRQNFGATVGGPVIIPGVYNGTRRTNFTATYSGSRGANLFDQYATVPTAAQRSGDFSNLSAALINPATGQPFPGNQIPQASINSGSQALLQFIPLPNLDGTSRNYHTVTTTDTKSDAVTLRVTHTFTQAAAGRGGAGGRGGGGGGRAGGAGRGGQALNINMTAQVQYRRNDNEQNNVLPTLGGRSTGSSFTAPITINISKNRVQHAINLNLSRSTSTTSNRFANIEDVAGGAGIVGVSTDPFTWGVPSLSFSSLSSVRDVTPSRRVDTRLSVSYAWTKPFRLHTLRFGGDYRHDWSDSRTESNAQGAFTFSGLYSSGSTSVRGGGYDFADFLLGLPQQATVNYGPGVVKMRGRSFSLYAQDDWRKSANLTFNLGIRYELILPFVEANGEMVNLDAAPGFTAVVPVVSGGTGAYSGAYPDGLLLADGNNIAPRVGFAWRVAPGTIVRGGYGISFNSGSYASIARNMVGQPPFAVTNTAIGTLNAPLSINAPLATATPDEITNDYGVARDYQLGLIQTFNVDLSRDLSQVWNVGANYTYIRGSNLDMLRAPNRGPNGLLIDGVQPFLWQSDEGSSRAHAAVFRLSRRPVRGVGGGLSYTLASSRDNASSTGGGSVVAQNDKDLEAEWGRSSFDRRHQFSANMNVELPWGPGRPWLQEGGFLGRILENWRFTTTFTWQSGTPLTARIVGAATSVAQGASGTLRANYSGDDISLSTPTIDRYFNTAAFSIPDAGTFGNSSRNLIVGPGSRLLDAQFSRDIRLVGTRTLSVQLNANNLLNFVNYANVDTVVNSPTFGQITSVRPMRSMTLNLRFRY